MRIYKGANGWRVRLRVRGEDISESGFTSKAQAQAWAIKREAEILARARGEVIRGKTFADAVERYIAEVSVAKRGGDKEALRLRALLREVPWAGLQLDAVTPVMIAEWRDARCRATTYRGTPTSPATVRRYLTTIGHVFAVAVREWQWGHRNPVTMIKAPPDSPPRTQRVVEADEAALIAVTGYVEGQPWRTKAQAVGAAIVLAVETAMRQGEICALRWADVEATTVTLRTSKTGEGRQVPLSPRARAVLAHRGAADDLVIGCSAGQLNAYFRKLRARTGLHHIHFHDLRHEATTRLAARVDVMTLARITGHRDLKMLMVYYNPTMTEVASRL